LKIRSEKFEQHQPQAMAASHSIRTPLIVTGAQIARIEKTMNALPRAYLWHPGQRFEPGATATMSVLRMGVNIGFLGYF